MKKEQEYKSTSNSKVYNRLRKEKLASCSYCKWHSNFYRRSENDSWSTYCVDSKHPSWKLVSKNKKQWMEKPIKIHSYTSNKGNSFAYGKTIYHEIRW